ncbi:MAG: hypothetical protein ACREN6_13885 [Gemmatimonadaceae bacterium]
MSAKRVLEYSVLNDPRCSAPDRSDDDFAIQIVSLWIRIYYERLIVAQASAVLDVVEATDISRGRALDARVVNSHSELSP